MPNTINYPDVLGLITGGVRLNINVAQVALAARPRTVRAGRLFEVIALVQNAGDSDIDVTLTLHLPPADAKKQHERFISKTQKLVIRVKAAEVGYVVLPVMTLADIALGDYQIGVEIEVKPLGKPDRIRALEGGGKVQVAWLNEGTQATIDGLKALEYTTTKRRSQIDVPLTVTEGSIGKMSDITPGWVSLCKLSDYHDNRLLLHHYGPLVQVNTLPKLKRALLFQPLLETTTQRFAGAGYALMEAEAIAVAKLLTLVLEYATPRFNAHGGIAARNMDVEALIMRDPFTFDPPPVFPFWFRGMIEALERDERAASYPAQVITRYLYDDLLRDAVSFGFDLVHEATGEDLGSKDEQDTYREQLIELLHAKSGLDFNRVALPLVLGGLLINDQVTLEGENPADFLREIGTALESRSAEGLADAAVFDMCSTLLARAGQRYGFYFGA